MNAPQIALWVLGPIGSGKTSLLRSLPSGFRLVDQDAALQPEMVACGLPLDTRRHDSKQAAALTTLRREVAARVWTQPPIWRAQGVPLAFEVTGDKPHLLQIEVEKDRAAGYRSIGLGVRCPLAICLQRNRQRGRILPEPIVESTWDAFEHNLANNIYNTIFGRSAFTITTDTSPLDLEDWLEGMSASAK